MTASAVRKKSSLRGPTVARLSAVGNFLRLTVTAAVNKPSELCVGNFIMISLKPIRAVIPAFMILSLAAVTYARPVPDAANRKQHSGGELTPVHPAAFTVSDADNGKPVPARVTITDTNGVLCRVFNAPTNGTAVRDGLIYTRGTEVTIHLTEGEYVFYATRGTEWSRARQFVSVKSGSGAKTDLRIRREVDTSGFIAADTHIHTLTFSGHGDASVQERMITLAGEGVELAVATDHNHQTDYRPYQRKASLKKYFTPVTGNEVTTRVGHFNAFPLPPNKDVPEHRQTNWVKLVESMREKGAKVVILNHPRWQRQDVWQANGLNPVTGERASGTRVTFDGMELVNSGNVQTNILGLFRDWFSLLNRGEKVTSIGASDSHGVYPVVGQGRTYIRSSTDTPARINVKEVCKNILAGQTTVSFGIYSEVLVNDRFSMGQLATCSGPVKVQLRVAAPSWVRPRRALLFLNGVVVAERPLEASVGQVLDTRLEFSIAAPRHDAYLVCAVLGEPVTEPFWPTAQPYTLAACNPVYIDADNNRRYDSPRATAQRLIATTGKDLESQWQMIAELDDAIAVQAVDLLWSAADVALRRALLDRLAQAAGDRAAWSEFLQHVQPEQ